MGIFWRGFGEILASGIALNRLLICPPMCDREDLSDVPAAADADHAAPLEPLEKRSRSFPGQAVDAVRRRDYGLPGLQLNRTAALAAMNGGWLVRGL